MCVLNNEKKIINVMKRYFGIVHECNTVLCICASLTQSVVCIVEYNGTIVSQDCIRCNRVHISMGNVIPLFKCDKHCSHARTINTCLFILISDNIKGLPLKTTALFLFLFRF